jgi:hypothetical protein
VVYILLFINSKCLINVLIALVEMRHHSGKLIKNVIRNLAMKVAKFLFAGARILFAGARILFAGARILFAGTRFLFAGSTRLPGFMTVYHQNERLPSVSMDN